MRLERVDPRAEYLALLRQMDPADLQLLLGYGVPLKAVTLVCPVPCPVVLSPNRRRFAPDISGRGEEYRWGWVVPVCAADPVYPEEVETEDPEEVLSAGAVIDLVGFSPEAPGQLARRTGEGIVLGTIPPQLADPEPVRIFTDITDWLRAECKGLVLLEGGEAAARVLRQIRRIETADQAQAEKLARLVRGPRKTRITRPKTKGAKGETNHHERGTPG